MTTAFPNMLGKVMVSVVGSVGSDDLTFTDAKGNRYSFHYYQDCCAHCSIEEIEGSLSDLEGSPILQAEEVDSGDTPPPEGSEPESYTWTFYKFATVKGYVTVRWYGSSNGYYSERCEYRENDQYI